jgi:hypothetical protein
MITLMFHFKALFRHLLQETEKIIAADILKYEASCLPSHDILYLEFCDMTISRLQEPSRFLSSLPIWLLFVSAKDA